jgi:hypothetical protein
LDVKKEIIGAGPCRHQWLPGSAILVVALVAVQFERARLGRERVAVAVVEPGELLEQATQYVGREFKDRLRPRVSNLRGVGLQLADEFLEALFGPGGGRHWVFL